MYPDSIKHVKRQFVYHRVGHPVGPSGALLAAFTGGLIFGDPDRALALDHSRDAAPIDLNGSGRHQPSRCESRWS